MRPNLNSSNVSPRVQSVSKVIKTNPIIHKNVFPQPEIVEEPIHEFKENPYKVTEIEKLKQQLKNEIIIELNNSGVFNKIKKIQDLIKVQTSKDVNDWNSDLLLININEELGSILNTPF